MNVLKVRYDSPEAPAQFTHSLRETGFAVVTGHPIRANLVRQTFADWEGFFASEDKHRYTFDPERQSGYFPFRTEKAKDSSLKDLKEFFHLYPGTELPAGLSGATRELQERLSLMAAQLLGWIEEHSPAEVKRGYKMPLPAMIENSQEILLRPIHYPPLTGGEEVGAIRAAAHEDINLITLLPAATAPGLQVKDAQGRWHDVDCDPGSIVVNAGDMLQVASQGYFRSTTHRVVNPKGPEATLPRYSMPLFLHPRKDVLLSDTLTSGEYLRQRLIEIGLLKEQGKDTALR